MPLMHAQAVIFTMPFFYVHTNNTVTSLSNNLPLHNHKQDVRNISIWDQFVSILKAFINLKNSNDFKTKMEAKSAVYTQAYTVCENLGQRSR